MSKDISSILSGWPFDPESNSARIVRGDDGEEKLQVRLDLGLLQMDFHGRPDGERPEGAESWLEWYEQRQREHDAAHPDGPPFLLEGTDCARLLSEGVQYYHRYLGFWQVRRYELCARDTKRNLRLFAFVREHARREADKIQFDQWRPYVTMMHTKSVAAPLVELRQSDAAMAVIEAGIAAIEQFLVDYEQTHRKDQCFELLHLQAWLAEVRASRRQGAAVPEHEPIDRPIDRLAALRVALATAVAEERFEDAARLRDEIRLAGESG